MGQGLVGQLALHVVDGLERPCQVLLRQSCADECHVGTHAAVLGGGLLQIGDGSQVAARQLRQCSRGAHLRIVGCKLGRSLEGGLGLLAFAQLQPGLACHRQAGSVDLLALQHRSEHFNHLVRLVGIQVGLRQHVARAQQPRHTLESLGEESLGLGELPHAELGRTGEFEYPRVVGHQLEHAVGDLTRALEVLVRQGGLSLEEERFGMSGRDLLQLFDLRPRLAVFALRRQQLDHGGIGRQGFGVGRQHLAVGLQRRRGVLLAGGEDLALEHAGTLVVGLLGQDRFEQGQRTIEVAVAGLHPRLHDDCGRVHRLGLQRHLQGLARLVRVGLRRIGHGHRGLQVGRGGGVLEPQAGVLGDDLGFFTDRQPGARQFRRHLLFGDLEFLGLAQFDRGRHRVTACEQGLAQQQTGLAGVGILLDRVLELDEGCPGVLLFDRHLGSVDHVFLASAPAPSHGQDGNCKTGGAKAAGHHETPRGV